MFVEVLVLKSVVLEGGDCLLDDTQPDKRAGDYFRAPMLTLMD